MKTKLLILLTGLSCLPAFGAGEKVSHAYFKGQNDYASPPIVITKETITVRLTGGAPATRATILRNENDNRTVYSFKRSGTYKVVPGKYVHRVKGTILGKGAIHSRITHK